MADIIIEGAKVHNLRNINVRIPRNSLTVVTGLSGSGKSSLAYAPTAAAANLTVTVGADGVTKLAGKLGGYSISASGYVNVGRLGDGVLVADFAPIVTVGKDKTAKKYQFVVCTNLWFDRSNEQDDGVGTAYIEP